MGINANWTVVPTLRGEHVTLEPLRMEHAEALRAAPGPAPSGEQPHKYVGGLR